MILEINTFHVVFNKWLRMFIKRGNMNKLFILSFLVFVISCHDKDVIRESNRQAECIIYWVADDHPKEHDWEFHSRRVSIGATIYNHTNNKLFVPVQDWGDSIFRSKIMALYNDSDLVYNSEIRFSKNKRIFDEITKRGNNYILDANDSMYITLRIATPSLQRANIPLEIPLDTLFHHLVFKYHKCYNDTDKVKLPISDMIFKDSIIQIYQPGPNNDVD